MSVRLLSGLTPYCGAAPFPDQLWQRWHFEWPLAAFFVTILVVYLASRPARTAAVWFASGWTVALLTLVSPLCALSVALFSARVGEHMVLTCIAAPLLILGVIDRLPTVRPLLPAAVYAAVLWFWHAPAPYTATFHSDFAFWAMEITLMASALWFWAGLFSPARNLAETLLAVFLTTGQMGLLGAIITFAPRAVYAPHLVTPYAWGLTPLEDQQLGGVVMWVPAGVILALAVALVFAGTMRRAEAHGRAVIGTAR